MQKEHEIPFGKTSQFTLITVTAPVMSFQMEFHVHRSSCPVFYLCETAAAHNVIIVYGPHTLLGGGFKDKVLPDF